MKLSHLSMRFQKWVMFCLLPAFAFIGNPVLANPSGGVVVHGVANINQVSANQLTIHQQTNTAIINWDNFSIDAGQLTQFVQPGSGSAVLNRVVSGNVTQIHGALQANGSVFVINPNGVFIGAGGVVDVGGHAVLSTLDIDNDDFLSGGPNRFYGDSQTGVTNFGTISSAGGDVILMGGFVDNQGQIGAMNGTVALASGGDILLNQVNGSTVSVQGASSYEGVGVNNDGVITGASAELKAHGNVYALAINNGNTIRATGATRSGGRVRLMASGSSSNINLGDSSSIVSRAVTSGGDIEINSAGGDVTVGGVVDAGSNIDGGTVSIVGNNVTQSENSVINVAGGSVGGSATLDAVESMTLNGSVVADSAFGDAGSATITGKNILLNDEASVTADGGAVGGVIKIGGDFQGRDTGLREADRTAVAEGASISADSDRGDAGTAIVWANNDTIFLGDISANATGMVGNGGLVEVSGKQNLAFGGNATATSANGESGTVLFDPGDVTVGTFPAGALTSPVTTSTVSIESINDTLQGGTNVLIVTDSGTITFAAVGGSGFDPNGNALTERHNSVQWTNSQASFGAFASEHIVIENHIRTSGGGSINLIAGWTGGEGDAQLAFSPQDAFDFYMSQGQFGEGGGSIFVGSNNLARHVIVGSRFGDTNLGAFDVRVYGSDTNSISRFSQIGFHDGGNLFAPRLDNGGGIVLDLIEDATGNWYLSDGVNGLGMAENGIGDPIVGVVGQFEVDRNGDGIADGVMGINSSGNLDDTFIPYANSYTDGHGSGNWWWQQIEQDAGAGFDAAGNAVALAGSQETQDPLGLGGLRPEMGAGAASNGADINVIARGNVLVEAGSGRDQNSAMIGHGGVNHANWGGAGTSVREIGNEDPANANFSVSTNGDPNQIIERGQIERRWSFNGSTQDRNSTSIARLAPVYGNVTVLAGVDATAGVTLNHSAGTVSATVGSGGSVKVAAAQDFETGSVSSNSFAQIGHGGVGQFGEFYGDVYVEAGGSVTLEAGNGTRSHAKIGHTFNGHAYWNPTNVANQQIRFFATAGDFDNPNLRRGELFSGAVTTGFDPALDPAAALRSPTPTGQTSGATYTRGQAGPGGTNANGPGALAPLTLAPNGPITIEALDGSTVSGQHGDVTVIANSGSIDITGYSTPDDVTIAAARDRRFAGIGHGGSSFTFWTEGAGYLDIQDGATTPGGNDGREVVIWEVEDGASGSRSQIGNSGRAERARALQFMTVTGDVDVRSGGDITLTSGNDIFDFTHIGHGMTDFADGETSSFVLGDINVQAAGAISLTGGGVVRHQGRGGNNDNVDLNAFSMIGHGGYRSGFMNFTGDVLVDAGGDVNLTGGAYTGTFAKIGHQGVEDYGQVGGNFNRTENFFRDNNSVDIESVLTDAAVTVDYNFVTDGVDPAAKDFSGAGEVLGGRTTTDVEVRSGGSINMTHTQIGQRRVDDLDLAQINIDNQNDGIRTRRSYVMIGHGGRATDALNERNPSTNFGDKVGNITVDATGDIVMENGEGEERWTRIGHGLSRSDRVDANTTAVNRAVELAGNISVTAGGDVRVDASAAPENDRDENTEALFGSAAPSRWNPVAIGHGGVENNLDIVVLDGGEDINGFLASSDISVNAGGDLSVLGGNGIEASFAQIGHGYGSDQGNDAARRLGVPTGFSGDISINVSGSLLVEGGSNAWSETPDALSDEIAASVVGAFAAIGNGGYQIDAPASGDINVYVGANLDILGQRRTDPESTTPATAGYNLQNPAIGSDAVSSAFNFAKIGHVNAENENRQAGNGDTVQNASQEGDIVVVVGGDARVAGGTTPDIDSQTIFGAFAQVGHGGPGISGDVTGDVTVLVRGNLDVIEGSENTDGALVDFDFSANNYAMIGNGDNIKDATNTQASLFRTEALGTRSGDIVVAVGNNLNLDAALIGHADPATSNQQTIGNTQVAVSRLNPFFGGPGTLTAIDSTAITSGLFGAGSNLEIYMPARSNNLMDATTRLNESTDGFTVSPANFAAPFTGIGKQAGRDDEVYLTPDLWWDDAGVAANAQITGGGAFPTDAVSGQGGAIANVNDPGGLLNLATLTAGALGATGSAEYRGGNNVSGDGQYTLFFDSIEVVANTPPTPPPAPVFVPPPFIFDFDPFVFLDQFDSFTRDDRAIQDGLTGAEDSLFGGLGLFESDELSQEEPESWKLENSLDNMFGTRRDSFSEGELDEERRRDEERLARKVGPVGLTFYTFDPGTNRYSSYRVFGSPLQ